MKVTGLEVAVTQAGATYYFLKLSTDDGFVSSRSQTSFRCRILEQVQPHE